MLNSDDRVPDPNWTVPDQYIQRRYRRSVAELSFSIDNIFKSAGSDSIGAWALPTHARIEQRIAFVLRIEKRWLCNTGDMSCVLM